MENIVQKAMSRATQAEVFRTSRIEIPISFEANRLKMLETKESSGVSLRIVHDGRIGFSATNDPTDTNGVLERAFEVSEFGAHAKFELPGPESYQPVEVYDKRTEATDIETMVELGQTMIDDIRKVNKELICDASVVKSISTTKIVNSNGGLAEYTKSIFSLALHATLIRGTDMLFVGDWDSSISPELDPSVITNRVKLQLELARKTVPAPTGDLPVIFSPKGVAGALISPLTTALNGRTLLQGASPLEDKLGESILDQNFNMWDDPTTDIRPGSTHVDDEGVPTRKLELFLNGSPQQFIYDLQTAGQAGVQSTGSATRNLGSLPSPSPRVLIVGSGKMSMQQMIEDIDDGLIVEQLLGAGQGNVLGGDFGGNVLLGYRIHKGAVTGRVKDTMIAGNVFKALNNVIGFGSESEWVGGNLRTPPICCFGVSVSSKA